MVVLDTSAWIEWFLGSQIGAQFGIEDLDYDTIFVPTIVQFELAKWLRREISEISADHALIFTMKCSVVELDSARALRAAELANQHKLSMADAIIYACALEMDAQLLTCDSHFKELENVTLYEKKGKLQ